MTRGDLHWQQVRALSFRSFTFTLPLFWEITAYLFGRDKGQLQFHHREAFAAQLDWRRVPAEPDQPRTMHAVHGEPRLRQDGSQSSSSSLEVGERGPWLVGEADDGRRYASLYQPDTKLLIQWSLPFLEHVSQVELSGLLDSYAPNTSLMPAWELFGVRVRLPAAFTFLALRAQAADVALHCVGDGGRRHIVARRIGMAETLLAERSLVDLAELSLRREGGRIVSSEARAFRGHAGVHTRFVRRAERGLEALIARPQRGESQFWHDQHERRIYALVQWGKDPRDALALADVWGSPYGDGATRSPRAGAPSR